MTTGPKTAAERAAWAAGEWAIIDAPRRPALSARSHKRHAAVRPSVQRAAWAAGEWAMPETLDEELD